MKFNPRQKKVINAKERRIVCLASAGSGKSIPNSTIIPTPNGWKKVSEIKEGDFLFDQEGNPTKVLGVFPQGEKEVYEITFGDKRTAKCCIDHIWSVHKDTWKDKNKFKDYTLKEILEDTWERVDKRGHKSHPFSIPCSKAVKYNTAEKLTIDPYLLGVFLGDGSCLESALTLSSNDKEMVEKIQSILGCSDIYQNPANYNWNFYKNNEKQRVQTKEFFGKYAENICRYSYEKSIPEVYKLASIEDRYKLIQGLMDTDGSITKSNGKYHVRFTTTSEKLKNDFIEVMGSLGYVCTCRTDKREEKYTTGQEYEVKINIPNAEKYKLFSLSRKKNIAEECINKSQHRKYDRTTIVDIQDLGYKEEMTCFYVDNEKHLFLMNDYIVTHNTATLIERLRKILSEGEGECKVVCITFTTLAAEEIKKRLGNIPEGVYIGTIHGYANFVCLSNGIDTAKALSDGDFNEILQKALRIAKSQYPKVDHLLIDEFQDTAALEYSFIDKIPAKNVLLIGDERQTIYQFKGCNDQYLKNAVNDPFYKVYNLKDNYRNPQNIIDFADNFIKSLNQLSSPCKSVKTEDGYIKMCNFEVAINDLMEEKDWGSWFILTRTNKELAIVQRKLNEREIPNITFKKGDLELEELEKIMREDSVKVLTIHASKGLEQKKVIVVGGKTFKEEERKISYVAATRAEEELYWCPSLSGGKYNNLSIIKDNKTSFEKFKKNIVEWE